MLHNMISVLLAAIRTFLRGIAEEGEQPPIFCHPWVYVGFVLSELIASLGFHLILSQDNPWLYPLLIPVAMLGHVSHSLAASRRS